MSLARRQRRVGSAMLVALLLASQVCQAAGPAAATPVPAIADVALHDGGTLVGQVLNSSSVPQGGQQVILSQSGKAVATAKTDEKGRFVFQGVRGGTYLIETQNSNGVVRLWAPNTAPPAAKNAIVMVAQDGTAVRAQNRDDGYDVETWIFLGLAGTALGIGIYEVAKNDDGS